MSKFKTDYQAGQGKISASDLNARGRALSAMVGNLPRGSFIGPDGEVYVRPQGVDPASTITYIELTGATSQGDNRWSYNYKVVVPAAAGTWTDHPSALTDAELGTGWNTAEANNSATVAGNGVDLTAPPYDDGTAYLVAASVGSPVVPAWRAVVDGEKQMHFCFPNGIRMDCDEEEA